MGVALDIICHVFCADHAFVIQKMGGIRGIHFLLGDFHDFFHQDGIPGRRSIAVRDISRDQGDGDIGQCGNHLPDFLVQFFVIKRIHVLGIDQ